MTKVREFSAAVVFDTLGRVLLQQRGHVPDILCPGMVGLFGGHREGEETFLDCVVREIQEELSWRIPAERFVRIAQLDGADAEVPGGLVRADLFVVRDVPTEKLFVTEGELKIVNVENVRSIMEQLTPSALTALRALSLV